MLARGKSPDEKPVRTPRVPTPEELGIGIGIGQAAVETVDWSDIRRQLQDRNASKFELERVAEGYRFRFWTAAGIVEGIGKTEAEAVATAFRKSNR